MRITHRALLVIVAVLAVTAVVGMVLLRPAEVEVADDDGFVQATRLVDGVLIDVVEIPGSGDETFGLVPGAVLVDVTARIEETGEVVEFTMLDDTGETFAAGQRVRLQEIEAADGETAYLVTDFRRERPLLLLFALFVFAVLSFGRLQGARALLGLALTFLIITLFIVPAILSGRDPVPVALVGAVVIMIVTLYLSHGFSRKTTAAVVGTAAALALTGALAVIFVAAAQITGFTSEEARLANVEVGGLSLTGLLLAGIIIGGLGVLDDVTMSQSSTVFELHRANPAAQFGDLLTGALTVGRDHIAATVNTLFLAYAGAALPLLILFVTGIDPLGTIVTSEIVAVEIVRTLVGSIGLIAAVPLTTALAAGIVLGDPEAARREAVLGGGHSHGAVHLEPRQGDSGSSAGSAPDRGSDRPLSPLEESDPEDEDWVGRLRDAYRTDRPGEQPEG
jgi:uncharacterized membrane protein